MTERASRLTLTRASATHAGVRTRAQRVALFFSRIWAWAFLGLMVLFFVIAVPLTTGGSVNFLTIRNSQNILVAIIPVLLFGLGQTFVIIAAGIDLSVGWVMSLASVLSALALRAGVQCRRCLSFPRSSSASSPPSPARRRSASSTASSSQS